MHSKQALRSSKPVKFAKRLRIQLIMNQELTFRLARPTDFDEILQLSDGIYAGHDYLPPTYHTWMKMDKVVVMLAHSGDKLVGLVASCVVDDERTSVRRAGRTLPEFRGQGIFSQLSQAMNEFVRGHYPNVCRERFTSIENYPSVTKLMQLDILSSRVIESSKTALQFHHSSTTTKSIQIEACTKEYLCDVIFSSSVAQKLFPDNAIILDFFPIEPLRTNIDYLQQERDVYFAVEKCSDGGFPRSVSFGVMSPTVNCTDWCVTIYTSDPKLYEAHLLYQFRRAREVIDGDFVFRTFQDKSLTQHGRRVLQKELQLELGEEMSKKSMKLYENKFD